MKKILIKIGKIIGIIIGIAIVCGIALGVYIYVHEELPKKQTNITVTFSPEQSCSKEFPMEVAIINDSSRSIEETEFDITVKRKGYSRNISAYSYSHYSTDRIIKPKEMYIACWTYPELEKEHVDKYKKEELIYDIGYKYLRFGD